MVEVWAAAVLGMSIVFISSLLSLQTLDTSLSMALGMFSVAIPMWAVLIVACQTLKMTKRVQKEKEEKKEAKEKSRSRWGDRLPRRFGVMIAILNWIGNFYGGLGWLAVLGHFGVSYVVGSILSCLSASTLVLLVFLGPMLFGPKKGEGSKK
jgi:hypothetical protein